MSNKGVPQIIVMVEVEAYKCSWCGGHLFAFLLSDLAVLDNKGFPLFILSFQEAFLGPLRLGDFYDYKELAAKDKVEATRTTLARIQESGTEGQRQILPAWEANLRRDEGISANLAEERRRRLKEAEQHRYPQVSWALKSLGRIEVVGPS